MIHTLLFTSSVLILGIFGVRKLTFERISMKARYALWLLAALRLLLPFSVGESPVSVMNVFPGVLSEERQAQTDLDGLGTERAASDSGSGAKAADLESEGGLFDGGNTVPQSGDGGQKTSGQSVAATHFIAGQIAGAEAPAWEPHAKAGENALKPQAFLGARHPRFLYLLLGGVWMFGFAAAGSYMLLSRQRFMRFLKKNRSVLLEEALPKEFAKRFSACGMKVYQVQGLPSPCLVGRDIYIGSLVVSDSQSLLHILAHEYCHALHKDGLWAFLRSFLAAVYWFDPFVWAAAYAARQDSELACDESAVRLLGETERFAYGRTLLNLLKNGDGAGGCPGMAYMLNRGEKGVRERISALAGCGRKKGAAAVMALLAALFLCGCAFTGAVKDEADGASGQKGQPISEKDEEAADMQEKEKELLEAARYAEEQIALMQEKEDELLNAAKRMEEVRDALEGRASDEAAFEEALNYHGVMEGKDDGELSLKRQFDVQTYYKWKGDKGVEKPEDGWYLLCEDQDAGISLYGLYTARFGFRGLKTLIGEDVNTFDGKWCASYLNSADSNIRVLEQAGDGLPGRFVWKLPAEDSETVEIWRFYYATRYDTGTVEVKTLTAEYCLSWAKEYLTLHVDQDAAKVHVTYDGDMYLGSIDISAYQDRQVEDVKIVSDAVCFGLDDPGSDIYAAYSDAVWEASVVHLAVGLKFEGVEGLWFDGLPLLTVQIAKDEKSASGFRLDYPRIDESYVARALWQEKELAGLRDGTLSAQSAGSEGTDGTAGAGKNDLEKPLVNEGEGHHDLAIDFINPCPDFDRISDVYGERIHPVTQKVRTHTGVDLAAPAGADILAAADGTVFATGFDTVNGNYVVLWHGQSGQMTYYAHCKTVEVTKGQEVKQGEKIAAVGQTGQATGPHLHFAISSAGSWEEPYFLELE